MPVLWSSALVLQALCQQLSKLVSRALDSADLGSASPDPPTGKRPLRDPPQTPPPSASSNGRSAAGVAPGIVIDGGAWQAEREDCKAAENQAVDESPRAREGATSDFTLVNFLPEAEVFFLKKQTREFSKGRVTLKIIATVERESENVENTKCIENLRVAL